MGKIWPSTALALSILAFAAIAAVGCGQDSSSAEGSKTDALPTSGDASDRATPKTQIPDRPPPKELVEKEVIEGTGIEAKDGDEVTINYALLDYGTGEEIESTWDRNKPYSIRIGEGKVIPGVEQGIVGMRVGGRRELTIPPDLAYGRKGRPPVVAPNTTLVFVIDLLAVASSLSAE